MGADILILAPADATSPSPLPLLLCSSNCLFSHLVPPPPPLSVSLFALSFSINIIQSSTSKSNAGRDQTNKNKAPPHHRSSLPPSSSTSPGDHLSLEVVAMASGLWTATEDKNFERALAIYDQDTRDRWEKVAAMVGGGKSAADVKRRYDVLVDDVQRIESGDIPFPNYRTTTSARSHANG